MAISKDKTRVMLTIPKVGAETIREEAKAMNLTVSQYVYLVMVANSFLGDERLATLAANQLEVSHDIARGYEPNEYQLQAPRVV